MSIRVTGVTRMLKEGNYQVFDRDEVTTAEDKVRMYRKAFECDYYLASVNAMSEDGIMVNIDGNGNRVAAITWGPEHVILVVSLKKVCQDLVCMNFMIGLDLNLLNIDLEQKEEDILKRMKTLDLGNIIYLVQLLILMIIQENKETLILSLDIFKIYFLP